jgi:hypothetical protein
MGKRNKPAAAVSDIMCEIDSLTEPDEMSKEDALEVLRDVIDQCRDRAACLREEIAAEEE